MTLSTGTFFCKRCRITFEGDYKPQTRPRKSCPKCHKMSDMTVSKSITSNQKRIDTETMGSSSTPQIPTYKDVNIKSLIKNWSIHQLHINSRAASKAVEILTKPEFLEQGEIIDHIYWTSEIPPYERPAFMYPWQTQGMMLMEQGHILWQASRQLAGKTTATFLKDIEDMIEVPNTLVGLVAPTVPLAVEVLFKFLYDPIKFNDESVRFYDILKPYFLKDPNQLGFTLKNGSRLKIFSLNVSGSQGRSIDILHIEEIDKLGTEQSKRIALAGIINSIRAKKDCKIRINCNNASGVFRLLKAELYKYGLYFAIFLEDAFLPGEPYTGRHTVINEDQIPKEEPQLDSILSIFSQVLVSFAFAEGQLYNIDNVTDETFNPDKVEIAYNTEYDREDYFVKTDMGIDPGGKVDAFGVSIWSLTKSGKVVLRWCKRFYNAKHQAKEQAKEIAEEVLRFNVEYCQVESSAGSPWSMSLISHYVNKFSDGKIRFRYEYVNFEGSGKVFGKDNFVYLFKILLDYEYIILFERNDEERVLHHQITKYIPNKSESNNNPDDLVESGFHGIWKLLGGMTYIKKLIDMEFAPPGITTQE